MRYDLGIRTCIHRSQLNPIMRQGIKLAMIRGERTKCEIKRVVERTLKGRISGRQWRMLRKEIRRS